MVNCMDKSEYDIAVIGAGTAGLSAAIYGKRAGKKVLVLEGTSYGGQIIVSPEVDNYPGIQHTSGFEFATGLYEQAIALGAEIIFENVTDINVSQNTKVIITDTNEYKTKSIIIATGLTKRKLGISREDELTGAGISYCATCDGAFYRGKDVMVNGGGNTALEDALFLSDYCNKVYVVHRRDKFRGEESLVAKLKVKENVEIVLEAQIKELIGSERLEKVKIVKNNSEEKVISVQGLFVAVGQIPKKDLYMDVVETDEAGYILAGEDCITNEAGVFAAGDCRAKEVRQLVTAAADVR